MKKTNLLIILFMLCITLIPPHFINSDNTEQKPLDHYEYENKKG